MRIAYETALSIIKQRWRALEIFSLLFSLCRFPAFKTNQTVPYQQLVPVAGLEPARGLLPKGF